MGGRGSHGSRNNSANSIGRHVITKNGNSIIYTIDSEEIYLDSILVNENNRQKGAGTNLLNGVIKISDTLNIPIRLMAEPIEGDMSAKQLVDWYKKRGFTIVNNYGSMGASMTYTPKRRKR